MLIIAFVMWITTSGIEVKIFPDATKACEFVDNSMTEPRVIAIISEVKGNVYKTSVYEIKCDKLKDKNVK